MPKDFTEECAAIIREMDPTAQTMRAITTCNGGEGSDWNVIQNWSGTYGGTADKYDQELKQPNQLLNGEYGAWRTLGFRSSDAEKLHAGDAKALSKSLYRRCLCISSQQEGDAGRKRQGQRLRPFPVALRIA